MRRTLPGRTARFARVAAVAKEACRPARFRFALCVVALSGVAPAHAKDCDRNCLIGSTGAYLAALTAHDPAAVPLADDMLFVENVIRIKPGEGLWKTTTARQSGLSLFVPDPLAQTAGWMGMMEESGKPVLVAIRLSFKDGKVAEAEHLIFRGLDAPRVATLQQPRAGLVREVVASKRLPRAKLAATAGTYYDALDENKGSLAPFAKDCERQDNGAVAVGPNVHTYPEPGYPHIDMTCGGQLDSGVMSYIDTIEDRRVFAVDPVYGLAMGLSHFHHKMDVKDTPVTLLDGTKGVRKLTNGPFDVVAAHIIKIGPEGKIHEIEAMGTTAPYMAPTGRE